MASGIIFPVVMPLGEDEGDSSDYRPVPSTDNGAGYTDRGQFGDWSANGGKPYDEPAGIKREAGFGASVDDLRRGFCEPAMRQDPAYDFENYRSRSSDPRVSDDDQGNRQFMSDDWDFQNRNRRSKGFLTRPRIPTER